MKTVHYLSALLIGYLVFGVSSYLLFAISGVDPHVRPEGSFVFFAIVYGSFFAYLGGYVTAWIARSRELLLSRILMLLIIVIAIISIMVTGGNNWSEISALFMSLLAPLGGWVRWKKHLRLNNAE